MTVLDMLSYDPWFVPSIIATIRMALWCQSFDQQNKCP